MSLTFDKADLEYGTAVTIGTGENAKTFELVESDDSDVTEEGNIRVVVANLDKNTTTSETIAAAFKTAIDAKLNDADDNGKYSAWAGALGVGTAGDAHGGSLSTIDGATITLTNATAGSASTAAEAGSTYGEVANVTLGYETDDEGKMKLAAGDTLVINGTTYQFDTTTRNLQGDNKLIRVSDFSDQKDVAEAIALAVNEDFKGKLSAKTNDDNTVTISGVFDEATQKFTSPSIEQSTVVTGGGLTLQIGDTSEDFNKLTVNIRDMHTDSIGTYTAGDTEMKLTEGKSIKDIDISTQDGAADALDVIKNAINMVSDVRGTLGASQNRLEHTINNLGVMRENIQNAESAIRDTDVAEEMMAYTKNNILVQSAQAMLAQANQLPQGVLQLLG
ncbi:MAG: hypothetical protein IKN81_03290 [Oscillospiraceae bacterium]|nr:hypothetical protein [Oscillospiraceae bacterium]